MKTILLIAISMCLGAFASVHATVTTEDVVYELPAGATTSTYIRQANSFRQWGADNIKEEIVSGAISEIAVADGKVYVANMLRYGTTGYIGIVVN